MKIVFRQRNLVWLCVGQLLCCSLLGCSRGLPTGEVHAVITLDGSPLKEGSIRFRPLDGKLPTSGGAIVDGKCYVQKVPVGTHRVEIESLIVKPGTPTNATIDQVETIQLIPEKYHANSELKLEVKSGLNEVDFKLTSR